MNLRRSAPRVLQSLLGFVLASTPLQAAGQELIAHVGTSVDTLTRNEARLFFTMRLKSWPDGTLVKVFVLPDNDALHRLFANEVLGLYPYQLRRVWDRQIFSGTGQAPLTVSSEQDMLDRVANTPGAIGYARSSVGQPGIRPLEVR